MITIMSCCYVSMSCHGMSAWVVFGLATLPFLTMRVLQVRFHDDIDGSSLARAIYASTGPLLLPFDSGFPTHTHLLIYMQTTHTECACLYIILCTYIIIYIHNAQLQPELSASSVQRETFPSVLVKCMAR